MAAHTRRSTAPMPDHHTRSSERRRGARHHKHRRAACIVMDVKDEIHSLDQPKTWHIARVRGRERAAPANKPDNWPTEAQWLRSHALDGRHRQPHASGGEATAFRWRARSGREAPRPPDRRAWSWSREARRRRPPPSTARRHSSPYKCTAMPRGASKSRQRGDLISGWGEPPARAVGGRPYMHNEQSYVQTLRAATKELCKPPTAVPRGILWNCRRCARVL